jgi:hypothetical protein
MYCFSAITGAEVRVKTHGRVHSACRPRACEEYRGLWGGGRAGLDRSWDLLVTQKGGREERRGEGEQVEGDEEQFVHGAEGEEDFLCDR